MLIFVAPPYSRAYWYEPGSVVSTSFRITSVDEVVIGRVLVIILPEGSVIFKIASEFKISVTTIFNSAISPGL